MQRQLTGDILSTLTLSVCQKPVGFLHPDMDSPVEVQPRSSQGQGDQTILGSSRLLAIVPMVFDATFHDPHPDW
jgi:hypothetical protein